MSESKKIYPICPECGQNTIVGFTPPRDKTDGLTTDDYEYWDHEKSHLYCCNAKTNCNYNPLFSELTTPQKESRKLLLTKTQRKTYQYLRRYIKTKDKSPTYLEIANRFGIVESAAFNRVINIEKRGYIKRNINGEITILYAQQ